MIFLGMMLLVRFTKTFLQSLVRFLKTRGWEIRVHSVIEPVWFEPVSFNHVPVDFEEDDCPDFALCVTAPISSFDRVTVSRRIDLEVG